MSGSTQVTASVSDVTYSQWIPWIGQSLTGFSFNGSTLIVHPRTLPNLTWSQLNQLYSISGASNSTGTGSVSLHVGFYTRSGNTLSILMSTSTTFSVNNQGTNNASVEHGLKLISTPWTSSLSKGDYWVGHLHQMATAGTAITVRPVYLAGPGANFTFNGYFGSSSGGANTSVQIQAGAGAFSVDTGALPSSMGISEIRGATVLSVIPAFAFGVSTT